MSASDPRHHGHGYHVRAGHLDSQCGFNLVQGREVRVVEEDVRFALPQELERMARERNVTLPARDVMRQSI